MKDLNPKHSHWAVLLAAGLLNFSAAIGLGAADESAPAPARPDREELREKLKNMTPEERRAAIMQWREQHPEAAAKVAELRNNRPELKTLTPEERAAKMKERRAAAEARMTALQKKKSGGTITTQESQQLERMEALVKARSTNPQPKVGDKDGAKEPSASADKSPADSGK